MPDINPRNENGTKKKKNKKGKTRFVAKDRMICDVFFPKKPRRKKEKINYHT